MCTCFKEGVYFGLWETFHTFKLCPTAMKLIWLQNRLKLSYNGGVCQFVLVVFCVHLKNAYCNNQGRMSNLGLFQCYFIVISEHTNFSLCLRVREAAMTSLMEVTMLVASSAPEILSPDLWVLYCNKTRKQNNLWEHRLFWSPSLSKNTHNWQ